MMNLKHTSILRPDKVGELVAKAVTEDNTCTVIVTIHHSDNANPVYGIYTSPDMVLHGGKLVHYSHLIRG